MEYGDFKTIKAIKICKDRKGSKCKEKGFCVTIATINSYSYNRSSSSLPRACALAIPISMAIPQLLHDHPLHLLGPPKGNLESHSGLNLFYSTHFLLVSFPSYPCAWDLMHAWPPKIFPKASLKVLPHQTQISSQTFLNPTEPSSIFSTQHGPLNTTNSWSHTNPPFPKPSYPLASTHSPNSYHTHHHQFAPYQHAHQSFLIPTLHKPLFN